MKTTVLTSIEFDNVFVAYNVEFDLKCYDQNKSIDFYHKIKPQEQHHTSAFATKDKKGNLKFWLLQPHQRHWQKVKQSIFVSFLKESGFTMQELPKELITVKTRDGAIVPAAGNGWALL